MADRKKIVAKHAAHLVNARNGGVVLAASALAAATWNELENRRVLRADLTEGHVRVERLSDLRSDPAALEAVEAGLRHEWGDFALLGFDNAVRMSKEAGQTIFIASHFEGGVRIPIGALQTILVDCHGDPEILQDMFENFSALTQKKAWRQSRRKGGDTAVLLQITIFAKDGRGGGLGSQLRDAVLHMLPSDVHYAITTTPADGSKVDLDDRSTFNPAMRFHTKGGASPTVLLPGFKMPAEGETPSAHGTDVMVMRYARDEEGHWPVPEPEMRKRSMGPMQRQAAIAARKLRVLGKRSRTAVSGITGSRRSRVHAASAKAWVFGKATDIAARSRNLVRREHETPAEGEAAAG